MHYKTLMKGFIQSKATFKNITKPRFAINCLIDPN
jgi:hypothetical protein